MVPAISCNIWHNHAMHQLVSGQSKNRKHDNRTTLNIVTIIYFLQLSFIMKNINNETYAVCAIYLQDWLLPFHPKHTGTTSDMLTILIFLIFFVSRHYNIVHCSLLFIDIQCCHVYENILNSCNLHPLESRGVARTVVMCRHFNETVGFTEGHSAEWE